MNISRNKAVVAQRFIHMNTYQKKEYFWGLVSHTEILKVKEMGYDLVIRVEEKPKHIYLQVGNENPELIKP